MQHASDHFCFKIQETKHQFWKMPLKMFAIIFFYLSKLYPVSLLSYDNLYYISVNTLISYWKFGCKFWQTNQPFCTLKLDLNCSLFIMMIVIQSNIHFKSRHDLYCFRHQHVWSKVTHTKVGITWIKSKYVNALVSNNTSAN